MTTTATTKPEKCDIVFVTYQPGIRPLQGVVLDVCCEKGCAAYVRLDDGTVGEFAREQIVEIIGH